MLSRLLPIGTVALGFFALASISPAQAVPAPGPDAFGYFATEIPNSLRNISTTGNNVGAGDDTVTGPVPLGFNFDFYGNTYSSVYISSNGWMSFSSTSDSGCCSGPALPGASSPPSNLIAGFWNDLYATNSPVKYQTFGSPGSREFVLGFYDVPNYLSGPQVTFEIVLRELYDSIEIQYGSVGSDTSSLTAGISNPGNTIALTLANSIVAADPGLSNRGFYFAVPGPLPVVGAAAAFGWSRRLRRRVRQVASPATSIVS